MERVVDELSLYIRALLVRFGVADADLDDLVQDVLVAIWQHRELERYDPARGKLTTLLWWRVRSLAANYRRKKRDEARMWTEWAVPVRVAPMAETQVVRGAQLRELHRRLSRVQQRVLLLLMQGVRRTDIARQLGLSHDQMYYACRRIKDAAGACV